MDRKSFFKNALLALGATIAPSFILRAMEKEEDQRYRHIGGYLQESADPIKLYAYKGMPSGRWSDEEINEAFRNKLKTIEPVKVKDYYWCEYKGGPHYESLRRIVNNEILRVKHTSTEKIVELKREMSNRGEGYRKYKKAELGLLDMYSKINH